MRPAVPMAAALAAGILAADWLRPHPLLVLLTFLAVAWAAWRSRGGRRPGALLLSALALFGALHHAYLQTAGRGSLGAWEGQRVAITGTVVSEPEVQAGQAVSYLLRAERVGETEADGRLHVTQWGGDTPGYGERVRVEGWLRRPAGARVPGGFDQAAYLARQSVYLTLNTGPVEPLGPGRLDPMRRAAVAARLRLEAVLREALPPAEASLMAGLLFGSRSDLPEDVKEAFRAAGVFHLLAVSGGNVAMLTVPLLWLLRRAGAGPRLASALVVPVVVFFIFLTGATPSVLRAGLMAVLVLLGDLLERERNPLNTLAVAVALLLAWAPSLLFDIGFQLSVGATLGILLLARTVEAWLAPRLESLFGGRAGRWLAAGLSVTLSAQAMVEPLSLHYFGTFSAIAPAANLVVVLFVGWLVPLGLAGVALGALLPPVAWLLGKATGPAVSALIYLVKAMATLPLAHLEPGRLPAGGVAAWYAGLWLLLHPQARAGAAQLIVRLRSAAQAANRPAAAALLLGLLATTLLWRHALAGPPDELRVTFMDVGQGDAILVEAPGGRTLLVDAGPAFRGRDGAMEFDAGEAVVVPYLRQRGIRRLDHVVLTHPDADHAGGGGAVLSRVPVGALWLTALGAPEDGQARALALARERGVPIRLPVEGEQIDLGQGVTVEVLGPPRRPLSGTRSDDNANCIALRLRYRQVAVLLACDLEAEAEERLLAAGYDLRADVLKVSHHGSGNSSTLPFLQAVAPRHAVISAGEGNPFGHPHEAALGRLGAVGAQIWRTDRQGSITLRTDGFAVRLSAAREAAGERPLALLGRSLLGAW